MELVFPTIEHKEAALEYRQEHFDAGEKLIHGDGGLDEAETYEGWLEKIGQDLTVPPCADRVPATTYFAVHDGKIIGTIQVRHRLNDFLRKTYGHIGYGVRPSERRKGYAAQMLALALEKARELGLDKVMVSCDKTNIGSARTIVKNGGVPGEEYTHEGTAGQQYWIAL